jgi:hypothetical protein
VVNVFLDELEATGFGEAPDVDKLMLRRLGKQGRYTAVA